MNALTVQVICGFGIGTSTLLKIKIQNVITEMGIDGDVFTGDISSAATVCDVIFTTKELAENVRSRAAAPVIVINNLMDSAEIKEKMEEFILNR